MAGADPTGSFVGDTFRTQIRAVMVMSLPNTVSEQPTFQWVYEGQYATADPAGNPWDWSATPVTSGPQPITDLQVTCAVTYAQDQETGTDAGEINAEKISITLLDTEHDTLVAHGGRMPDRVVINGITYIFDYMVIQALYDVDVYTCHASSVDS